MVARDLHFVREDFYTFEPRHGLLRITNMHNRLLFTVVSSIQSNDLLEHIGGYSAPIIPSLIGV